MAKKQIFAAVVISVASFFVFGQKAHAATINVVAGNDGVVANGQCQLSEAIQNVSNQAATYPDCIAGNGSDDAISLPNGVITLTSNLANATRGLKIIGASKAGTTINANGFIGLIMALSPVKTYDVTLENLTLNGALDFGFSIQSAKNVVMKNVKTDNSDSGVKIVGADLISLNDCDITNNNNPLTNGDQNAGLTIEDSNSITISGLKIINNKVSSTGSAVSGLSMIGAKNTLIKNTTIMGNTSSLASGLWAISPAGPASNEDATFLVDASTISNNTVTVTSPEQVTAGQPHLPVIAGVFITGRLAEQQNFTNVTVSGNVVNSPTPDNRNSVAGFMAILGKAGASLRITNATVVNNSVTQPSQRTAFGSFIMVRVDLDLSNYPTIVVNSFDKGSSSENGLIAHNFRNGQPRNCTGNVDLMNLSLNGVIDATPVNLGHNLTDDQTCTGYDYISGLWDTIDHDVADNGGAVPTIKLLPGSPAINGGGQVLGISTDARGVARTGYYSVGAYQGLLAASTTHGNGSLANTGAVIATAVLVLLFVASVVSIYFDYRRHKRPLIEADPNARYTLTHHVRLVTLPLIWYRLSFSLHNKHGKGLVRKF